MSQFERLKLAVEKARDVREAQRAYFRTRDQGALTRSKGLEKELDKLIPAALQDDDMLQMMESAGTVGALPNPEGREGAERIVTDCLPMLVKAIAIGGGMRKARVRSDGSNWRVAEWLDQDR
jgi:hypothetical protein